MAEPLSSPGADRGGPGPGALGSGPQPTPRSTPGSGLSPDPILVGGAGFTIGALFAPLPPWALGLAALLAVAVLLRRRARALFPLAVVAGATCAAVTLPPTAPLRALAEARAGAAFPATVRIAELPERTAAGLSMIVALEGGRARLALDEPCGSVGDTVSGQVRLATPEATWMPSFRARSLTVQRGVAVTGGLTACRVVEARPRSAWSAAITDPLLRALVLGDRGGARAPIDAVLSSGGQTQVLALGGLAPLLGAVLLALGLRRVLGAVERPLGALRRRPASAATHRTRGAASASPSVAYTSTSEARAASRAASTLGASASVSAPGGAGSAAASAASGAAAGARPTAAPPTSFAPALASLVAALALAALLLALGPTPTHLRVGALAAALLLALAWPRLSLRGALALTAGAVAALDPAGIGDTGFQLAFASTTAVVGLGPVLAARLSAPLGQGLALALGTAPLVVRQFERLSPLSILADALTFPLAALTGLAGLLVPLTAAPAALLGRVLGVTLDALAAHPFGALATPTVVECVLAYLVLGLLAARPRRTGALVLASLLLALVAGAPRLERRLLTEPRISVLPTHSGHAILVEGAHGTTVLVGVGGEHPDPDAHARMVGHLLKLRHAPRLDGLVLTATRTPAVERTLVLLQDAHPVPVTARVALDGVEVTPTAGGLTVRAGNQTLFVETSSRAESATGSATVVSRPTTSPVVRTAAGTWPVAAHGLVTLRGEPWEARPHRSAP